MSGAVGWATQVVSSGGGIRGDKMISLTGFYGAVILSLILGGLKLTVEAHWSWWRVFYRSG
jgi:hypothetical protein